jgi:hypothetical protein
MEYGEDVGWGGVKRKPNNGLPEIHADLQFH